MNRVAEGLFLGSLRDAVDHGALLEAGVEAVLQLYGSDRERAPFPIPVEVLQLPVQDRVPLPPSMLREGVEFIAAQRAVARTVLVCCGAGVSRSPVFVAAYLHEQGADLPDAFAAILRARPEIRPHPELLRSLIEYYSLSGEAADLIAALGRLRRDRGA